ncbi:Uncharacterized conserved protein, LabA/DUF88 family [Gemmobacter aquatilis]|uniref:Uncharacterized conserved protein, LabA/DUF88 family n=1 Tax=Gemmobacter aquatilis TaxID=933059 RepID=A0A1H8JZM3_9RHOB|nr:NYN domain-containing protein [Gemmobacter aquatilis]SEN86209.1 Uncharacterized conserved protein, LabA/DUF88 family [Gemmobacter aquatilis]
MTLPFQDLAASVAPKTRLALCIDGENLSAALAGQIITRALGFGQPAIRRVYGNAAQLPQWDAAPGFRLVHSGKGKNATDLLLTVEAMALIHDGLADALVIASSDRDFSHLATHLRERGTPVIGMGEAKTSADFRKACTKFIELGQAVVPVLPAPEPKAKPKPIDAFLRELFNEGPKTGLPISAVNQAVQKWGNFKLSTAGYSSWKQFFAARAEEYEVIPAANGPLIRWRNR